jgi:hypothetical protein
MTPTTLRTQLLVLVTRAPRHLASQYARALDARTDTVAITLKALCVKGVLQRAVDPNMRGRYRYWRA